MVKTRPMMLKVSPATAIPRLVDFMPFSDMTSPTIVTGKPNSGRSQASIPMMPRTSPAVALPVGLSVGFGDVVFSIVCFVVGVSSGLTKKAEPPPTRGVNRDSGTASANGGWLRRLVRRSRGHINK